MKCPNCNAHCNPGDVYCQNCGFRLQDFSTIKQPVSPNTKQHSRVSIPLVVAVTALTTLLVVGAVLFFLNRGNKTTTLIPQQEVHIAEEQNTQQGSLQAQSAQTPQPKTESPANTAPSQTASIASDLLPDGSYYYEGTWNSVNFDPQPCNVKFTKNGNQLSHCSYTNEHWNSKVNMKGHIKGKNIILKGICNNQPLVITIPIKDDMYYLVANGTQGSKDRATIALTQAR